MRKKLNVILFLMILTCTFTLAIPVIAEEIVTPTIEVVSLTQGDEVLELEDGKYDIVNYERVDLQFKINNPISDKRYYLEIESESSASSIIYAGSLLKNHIETWGLDISTTTDTTNYTLKICEANEGYECEKVIDTKEIKIYNTFHNEFNPNHSYLLIQEVSQGGKIIEPIIDVYDWPARYELNDFQDVIIKLKGENLPEDIEFNFSTDWSNQTKYKGSELNSGITVTIPLSDENDYISINWGLNMYQQSLSPTYKHENGNYYLMSYFFEEDETIETYTYELKYANYEDIKIDNEKDEEDYRQYNVINNKYHNKDNPLTLIINGNKYQDKDYDINIIFGKNNSTSKYEKKITVNGLELNKGYEIELDNLTLTLPTTEEDLQLYELTINDGYTTIETDYKYSSTTENIYINADLYYGDGLQNLAAFKGIGNEYGDGGFFETYKNVFDNNSSMYFRYLGENFDETKEYNYVLEYGYTIDADIAPKFKYVEQLDSGKINGRIFNNKGILFKIVNPNNYDLPVYRLTIKDGEEILFYSNPIVELVDYPTFANVNLVANNKNLYVRTSDNSYIATRNSTIDINIAGAGFIDNENYSIRYCEIPNFDYDQEECKSLIFTGEELNNGKATIHFDKEITEDIEYYSFYVIGEFGAVAQGGFEITFVDSKDFFKQVTNYVVDNTLDIIKNIKKETNVNLFNDNLEITDNGNIEVYNQDEELLKTDYIGTGMTARIKDEFDTSLFDMDIVVKGDVNGDGNISITDLVKTKQHIAEIKELDGLYEMAGDITGENSISITDLVKMSQDVAEIEEIN